MVYSEKKTLIVSRNILKTLSAFKLCQYNRPEVCGPSVRGKLESKALNYSSNGGQTKVRYRSKSISFRCKVCCIHR